MTHSQVGTRPRTSRGIVVAGAVVSLAALVLGAIAVSSVIRGEPDGYENQHISRLASSLTLFFLGLSIVVNQLRNDWVNWVVLGCVLSSLAWWTLFL